VSDVYTAGAIANATKAVLVQERAFHAQYVAATQGLWDQAMTIKVSTAQETKSKQAELEAEIEQLRSQADKDQVAVAAGQLAVAAEAEQRAAHEQKLDAYLQAASRHLKAELDKLQASHAVKLKDFHAGYIRHFSTEIKNLKDANAKLTEECAAHREELSVCHARHSNKSIPKAKLESAGLLLQASHARQAKLEVAIQLSAPQAQSQGLACPATQAPAGRKLRARTGGTDYVEDGDAEGDDVGDTKSSPAGKRDGISVRFDGLKRRFIEAFEADPEARASINENFRTKMPTRVKLVMAALQLTGWELREDGAGMKHLAAR
jgi:hypothetical protein